MKKLKKLDGNLKFVFSTAAVWTVSRGAGKGMQNFRDPPSFPPGLSVHPAPTFSYLVRVVALFPVSVVCQGRDEAEVEESEERGLEIKGGIEIRVAKC